MPVPIDPRTAAWFRITSSFYHKLCGTFQNNTALSQMFETGPAASGIAKTISRIRRILFYSGVFESTTWIPGSYDGYSPGF